ncbi:MAG TPA: hypothetical protein PKO25_03965 [Spirochaetota bacterium]|mgnify:CR=1 FL=1|nr:hypothetical protein [Spirochaetota bacterium]OPZ38477.1 MAG: hypothetical protein BWY96_01015 [Spirochaetes bacterium ADurb.BinA120]HNU91004.1 hypothetical protein [Spirochaetota bacterium]HPI13370.1 hypothetical protein [Spirochaetota bacterium]HPO44593.1 hypothetical protein [Spirochaetota bacterium]
MKSGFVARCAVMLFPAALLCSASVAAVNTKAATPAKAPEAVSADHCLDCHKSLGGRHAEIADQWAASVHSKEGARCNLCHKGDDTTGDMKRAKSRDAGFIGKPSPRESLAFCGRAECHDLAFQQFKRSPHYDSVLKKGAPSCVSCHGDHNVQRSSIDIISDRTCSACHPVEYSREIISSIFSIEKDIESIEAGISLLESKKADVKNELLQMEKLKSLFHQIVHVFSREEIQFSRRIVDLEIASLKNGVMMKVDVSRRMDIIYITTIAVSFIIVFGLAFYVFWMLSRRRKE